MENFGHRVKEWRLKKGMTREDLCGDESQLSVRQLARIESGYSLPSLTKVLFLSRQLQVPLSDLVDSDRLKVPKHYKELKYLIIRTPTYMNPEKLAEKESYFDEVFSHYYPSLPNHEQLIMDFLQAKFDVYQTGNTNFGSAVLEENIRQLRQKDILDMKDLFLIDLYLTCAVVSSFSIKTFDSHDLDQLTLKLLKMEKTLDLTDLHMLNMVLLVVIDVNIRLGDYAKNYPILKACHRMMMKIEDFQRFPVYYMYQWKQALFDQDDQVKAQGFYKDSLLSAGLVDKQYLVHKLETEWQKDRDSKRRP